MDSDWRPIMAALGLIGVPTDAIFLTDYPGTPDGVPGY